MVQLTLEGISKSYGKKQALKDFSYTFTPGITALLSANGAGKSTLINIITTLIPASEGKVRYNGTDIGELRERYLEKISPLFQSQPMIKGYTAEEYLSFCGTLKGLSKERTEKQGKELMEQFGILESRKKKIASFSGGMRQRLALCGTFLGDPEILLLDEPSVGLDIYEREELKNYLCALKKERMILISTHIVPDVENIADRILLLNRGLLYSAGTQAELIHSLEGKVWEIPEGEEVPEGTEIYHSNGRCLCFAKKAPGPNAIGKVPDLTDVYFHCLMARDAL